MKRTGKLALLGIMLGAMLSRDSPELLLLDSSTRELGALAEQGSAFCCMHLWLYMHVMGIMIVMMNSSCNLSLGPGLHYTDTHLCSAHP